MEKSGTKAKVSQDKSWIKSKKMNEKRRTTVSDKQINWTMQAKNRNCLESLEKLN